MISSCLLCSPRGAAAVEISDAHIEAVPKLLPEVLESEVGGVEIGDEVCITGYIMDNFCIFETGGKLLDNRSVTTLGNPEKHSFHCLLDVSPCFQSGYQVLGPKNPYTGLHCLGFRIDDTDTILLAGRATGKKGGCSTCTGDDSSPIAGYRATVRGTVKEMGDGTYSVGGAPVLSNVQLLDANVGCDGGDTIPPLCITLPEPTSSSPSPPVLRCITPALVAIATLILSLS